METKKTPETDLEKGRLTFFLMGLAVALSGFFVLLEWETSGIKDSDWITLGPVFIESEFEGGSRIEEVSIPAVLPEIIEPEIVYEDFLITEEIPVIETVEETATASLLLETDKAMPSQAENITTAPEESGLIEDAPVATSAETMPQFPGGQVALIRFIYENIEYSSVALRQRIEGRVWCSFIVETDGSISNIRLEESVYIFLDDEAIRVLNLMPPWIPGQTNGENVRVKVYIPIVFRR
jgi:protein TonB